MTARMDSVAKYICKKSNWQLSNLQLQKLMYLAQMVHLGRTGARLFDGEFQAWDLGPVEPNLYHKAKFFGADPVGDVFFDARDFAEDDPRRVVMDDVCGRFFDFSAGDLVEITHWDGGAWAKHYVPKARGIRIPDSDIRQEYLDRQAPNAA